MPERISRADQFEIIAHRGASGYAPENTGAACELALELGASAIELDARLTKDGHLVAWHDATIDRTARFSNGNRSGHVSEMTLAELLASDIGTWFNEGFPLLARPGFRSLTPLTLEEALETYGSRVPLYIELKDVCNQPATIEAFVRALGSKVTSNVAALSEDLAVLDEVARACPEVAGVLLITEVRRSVAAAESISAISPRKDLVDAHMVAAAKWHDLAIYPHTVNHPGEIRRLIEMGVDGIITDLPDCVGAELSKTSLSTGSNQSA